MKRITRILLTMMLFSTLVNAQTIPLTKKIKAETIANIVASLKVNYIYLDTAIKMGNFIRHQFKTGSYDTIRSPHVFAAKLTADLLSVYRDGHLSISYDPSFTIMSGKIDTVKEKERIIRFRKRVNFGFDKAEILQGNIGYIKIGGFFEPDNEAKEMARAAFRFISNSGSLIIDLRNNMGGDPRMVSFICGFFFDKETHLNDLYSRKNGATTIYQAIPDSTLKTLYKIPVYILTSNSTFSAGEELTYDLQTQNRAVVIGEDTGGGAHPVQPFTISNGFIANIPYARAINPVTKSDWELTGVIPDKKVPKEDALNTALEIIRMKK